MMKNKACLYPAIKTEISSTIHFNYSLAAIIRVGVNSTGVQRYNKRVDSGGTPTVHEETSVSMHSTSII